MAIRDPTIRRAVSLTVNHGGAVLVATEWALETGLNSLLEYARASSAIVQRPLMEQATSTFDLVERARDGDREAFSELLAKHERRLAVIIHYKLGPALRRVTEVEDVLQETLLEAYRDIDQFKYQRPGSFLSWLSRIADHVMADLARFHGRERRHGELLPFRSASNPEGHEPVDSKTPSRLLSEKEGVLALIDKLDQLPEDYRRAILLAKVEGLSTQELAEQMGRSREAAALLLHRAIKRFRSLQPSVPLR